MYKLYQVKRTSGEILEGFNTLKAAEEFLQMMKDKGEDVILHTSDDDIIEEEEGFDIEGLDVVEPKNEFGDELNKEYSDDTEFDINDL